MHEFWHATGRWACLGDLTQDGRRRPVPAGELVSGARRELVKAVVGIAMAGDDAPVPAAGAGSGRSRAPARPGRSCRPWPAPESGRSLAGRRHPHGVYQAAVAGEQVPALARQLGQHRLTGARAFVDGLAQRARLRADISPPSQPASRGC